ncbi:MAG TPA: PIG-L family deacetylase [Herpetosiphonaceae bacterium]
MHAKRLLAVWAHPDDEAFGPVGTMRLAHDRGWRTAVITATRGDAGNDDAADLAPGQTLGDLREHELRCSAEVLGIERIDVWRHPDGGLQNLPPGLLAEQVLEVMRDWQPTIVLTFGPDGITGHPDHLAIHDATEQAFARYRAECQTERPPRLYYVTIRPKRTIEHPMGAAPPHAPPTAVLDVSAYEQIKRDALSCHASQRADWEPLLADRDWLTIDRLFRAFPPAAPNAPPETTIFDE